MAYPEYHTLGVLENNVDLGYILPTAFLGFLVILTWRWMTKPAIPTVNSYFGDITLRKAHSRFLLNARGLIKEGSEKVS